MEALRASDAACRSLKAPKKSRRTSRIEVAAPVRARWEKLAALLAFVAVAVLAVKLTGWRFILFPPLVVIGFEMFVHPDVCPWAKRPLMLPVACFLTALGGFIFWKFLGVTPLTAALCMGWGIIVLRTRRSCTCRPRSRSRCCRW